MRSGAGNDGQRIFGGRGSGLLICINSSPRQDRARVNGG